MTVTTTGSDGCSVASSLVTVKHFHECSPEVPVVDGVENDVVCGTERRQGYLDHIHGATHKYMIISTRYFLKMKTNHQLDDDKTSSHREC